MAVNVLCPQATPITAVTRTLTRGWRKFRPGSRASSSSSKKSAREGLRLVAIATVDQTPRPRASGFSRPIEFRVLEMPRPWPPSLVWVAATIAALLRALPFLSVVLRTPLPGTAALPVGYIADDVPALSFRLA